MNVTFYGFEENALKPVEAFAKSLTPPLVTEIFPLSPPHKAEGKEYRFRLTVEVPMEDRRQAGYVFNGLDTVSEGAGFGCDTGGFVSYQLKHIREGVQKDDGEVANQKVAA